MREFSSAAALTRHIADLAVEQSSMRFAPAFVTAISGPDCVGKSSIANLVVDVLRASNVQVRLMRIDDFLIPRAQRDGLPDEATNYYEHGFDYVRLRETVAKATPTKSPAIVVVEGVFLLRRDLLDLWDLAVWLDTDDQTIESRGVARDSAYFGGPSEARRVYLSRLLPAQALHRRRDSPETSASASFHWDGRVWRPIAKP